MNTHRNSIKQVFSRLPVLVLTAALIAGNGWADDKSADGKSKPNLTGTWKWTFNIPNGDTIEPFVKLKQDGDKLTGDLNWRGTDTAVSEGRIKDGEVSFKVFRERDGRKVTTSYKGKLDGDTIKGKYESDWSGETRSFDWEAKRAKEAARAAGTWKWSFTTQDGQTFETTLKLKQDGDKLTGTATGRGGNETEIEDGKIKGSDVSFKIVRERDGQKFTVKYKGELKGDSIKGNSERERDGQTVSRDWEAKRAKEVKE